jgi:hypothetical protein
MLVEQRTNFDSVFEIVVPRKSGSEDLAKTIGENTLMPKYKVGYCRPPKHTQFKKGQSGNPGGRPNWTLNVATVLENTLRQTVEVVDEKTNQKRTITKLEAAIQRLVDNAVEGDNYAFRVLSVLTQILHEPEKAPTSAELEGADQKILNMLVHRFASAGSNQD